MMLQGHRWTDRWLHDRQLMAWAIAGLGALLAVYMRWYFIVHTEVYQPLRGHTDFGGAAEYYRYAWNLFHHHLFSSAYADSPQPLADSFRDPGYPLYLAAFMGIEPAYEEWYALVVLSHAVLGGLTVACIVLALRGALPTWLLAAVAVTTALWPHSVALSAYVLSENLTAPLWALAILLLREAASRQSVVVTIIAGLAFAAAGLTNSVITPLVLPLAAVLAWKRLMPARLVWVLVIAAVLPAGAWSVRNAQVTAGLSSTYRAKVNLVQGSWPTYHLATQLEARHDPVGIATSQAINAEIQVLDTDTTAGLRVMAARMARAPGTTIAWYLGKPALLWGWQVGLGAGGFYIYPTNHSPFVSEPLWRGIEALAFIANGLIAALALAGLGFALLDRKTGVALLGFAVTAGWVTLVYGVLQSDPRYSIPFRGAEMALAASALWTAGGVVRRRLGDRAHTN